MIEAVDISYRYGDVQALRGASLQVGEGDVVAIVGSSGAGKSSLLLCLCGLLVPQKGYVTLDGIELSAASTRVRDRLRRERFGFVFQFGELVPELTMVENVSLPLRLLGMPSRDALSEARAQMEVLGVAHLADKPITAVSGGELQRAAICRALVHTPSVVLADEPTGALDEENGRRVFDQMIEHATRRRAAVVVVTHESWLARRADRVLHIDQGRLAPAS